MHALMLVTSRRHSRAGNGKTGQSFFFANRKPTLFSHHHLSIHSRSASLLQAVKRRRRLGQQRGLALEALEIDLHRQRTELSRRLGSPSLPGPGPEANDEAPGPEANDEAVLALNLTLAQWTDVRDDWLVDDDGAAEGEER